MGLAGARLDADLQRRAAYPLWWLPVSVLVYLLLHDTWFYWTHRWLHRPRPFRSARRPPRQPPADRLGGDELPSVGGAHRRGGHPGAGLPRPDPRRVLGVVLAIMTVMGVTNHMGWEMFPRALVQSAGDWLITASHHQRHHQQYRCNYGLYFRLWDRLCGTDRGLGELLCRWRGCSCWALALTIGAGLPPAAAELDVAIGGLRNARAW